MTTIVQARIWQFITRLKHLFIAALIIGFLLFITSDKVGAIYKALTPPTMHKADLSKEVEWLGWESQNWTHAQTAEYHHKSQGTMTIPIPLEWFLALEQANSSPLSILWGRKGKFSADQHLANIGFIPGLDSPDNPHGLPVGFATTDYVDLPGTEGKETGIGFNCAACHTGQFTYKDKRYIVEGGPATVNLGFLTDALGAALGQTALSGKIPFFNGRFDRFAKNVLKDHYSDANKIALAAALDSTIAALGSVSSGEKVVEGSGRLDALNRIGNQVFANAVNRPENYAPIDAPVNFPHIWTTSWFDWVQYDGSIMQPLIRNAGEAMGVAANVNTSADAGQHRFSSSIPMENLRWIERQLSGEYPVPDQKFGGLWEPQWPEALGEIDVSMAEAGYELYQQHCQGCHLPPIESEAIWDHWGPIKWWEGNQQVQSPESVMKLKLISLSQVGTDPAQSNILMTRTVNTGNTYTDDKEKDNSMGIDAVVCTPNPILKNPKSDTFIPGLYQPFDTPEPQEDGYLLSISPEGEPQAQRIGLVKVPVTDGPRVSFALALGALVQQVNETWFALNYISAIDQQYFTEGRPNCLRASHAYKARPLNGVWATAPFLHNGSVPTLMDMLKPAEQRPKFVQLGTTEFDVEQVGIKQTLELDDNDNPVYINGIFILDTKLPGNLNTGHEFSSQWDGSKSYDQQKKGVIGPLLTNTERMQIIEFLKTI